MLADEVREAERHVFFSPRPRTVVERLGARRTLLWADHSEVAVSNSHLRFEGRRTRHTSRSTIEAVIRAGDLIWIQRRSAHDWLVRCPTEADAVALVAALGEG